MSENQPKINSIVQKVGIEFGECNIVALNMNNVKFKIRSEPGTISTSSTKNLTWTDLGFNQSLRRHRPAISRRSRGKAFPTKPFKISPSDRYQTEGSSHSE
jgi:hypothetical protein